MLGEAKFKLCPSTDIVIFGGILSNVCNLIAFVFVLVRRAVALHVSLELNAVRLTTPAPCLHSVMPSHQMSLRKLFYALGVYATAHRVQPLLQNRTIILHR